jgi:hypothetical protein
VGERVWTVAEANAALHVAAALVQRAREAVRSVRAARVGRAELARRNGHRPPATADGEAALRDVLADAEARGIVLRDVDRGLVDFPAVSPSGRAYLLCWVVGEPEVAWWHWPEDGFPGRTPITEPPT